MKTRPALIRRYLRWTPLLCRPSFDTWGLFPSTPATPLLALNFVTCSETVQNNVALLGIVKSSLQVGGQGKLTSHNQRNKLSCKQAVCSGRNGAYGAWIIAAHYWIALCLIRYEP